MLADDFYQPHRWHLRLNCEVLQALYERRLTGKLFRQLAESIAPKWYILSVDWERLQDDKVYTKLIQNLPPRHGKSRTLVMFCEWILGKNVREKIISCSYNDDLASDFSRYTRDGIMTTKNLPTDIVYSDIFPNTKISKGNASFMQWALEKSFFNYKGAGVGGSVTGRGASVLLCDDVVKDAETAMNENALDKIWLWYTGTIMSRLEDGTTGGIEIQNATRWSKKDPTGRILAGPEGKEWLVLSIEACSPEGEMLCPDVLSKKKYESLKRVADPAIFMANYHQKPIDVQGKLYQQILTYTDLPKDDNGNLLTERVIAYCDTADSGNDYLACVIGHVYKGEGYITDIVYTKDGMEITEPLVAKSLHDNLVNLAVVESNAGGKTFARNVERIYYEKHKNRYTTFKWFAQSKNKVARIVTGSTFVMNHLFFPANWRDKWPDAYAHIMSYQREGKNTHDDIEDALTGFSEQISGGANFEGLIRWMEQQKENKTSH